MIPKWTTLEHFNENICKNYPKIKMYPLMAAYEPALHLDIPSGFPRGLNPGHSCGKPESKLLIQLDWLSWLDSLHTYDFQPSIPQYFDSLLKVK